MPDSLRLVLCSLASNWLLAADREVCDCNIAARLLFVIGVLKHFAVCSALGLPIGKD